MNPYINILIIVNCIAAVHGIILSFILITKKRNRRANHILASMVFLFSIGMIAPVYVSTGIYLKFWWLAPFINSLPYTFGPLLYFYIKELTTPRFRFTRYSLLHTLPTQLAVLYYASVYFIPETSRQLFFHKIYFQASTSTYISIFISLTQALVYILLCLRLFKIHSQKIKKSYSDLDHVNLSWIRHLVILFIITWIVAAGLQSFLPEELMEKKLDDAITYFLLSLFIFTIGYRGLSQPEIFEPGVRMDHKTSVREDGEPGPPINQKRTKKYEKTGLSPVKSAKVKVNLLKLMEQKKLYLEPALTLPQVAEIMNLPVHHLSQVINHNMDQNFYRFINSYRVQEAMLRLRDSPTAGDKLIKIAFDSGFNSLSTFNRVFKDINGQSPSQFRKG